MRALILAAGLVVAATAPAFAADKKIEDFFGRYLGQGVVTPNDPTSPVGKPPQRRMSEVIIQPAKEDQEGFIITWSTMRAKDKDTPGASEADVKTYHQVFRATEEDNFFTDITSGDPLKGKPSSWARINGNTLSIVQVHIDPTGGYYVTHYDRTLTAKGLDVHFTRIEDAKIVREVNLKLEKGPLPMRN
jgi:hypothetical protein